jgi:hypothetical protein
MGYGKCDKRLKIFGIQSLIYENIYNAENQFFNLIAENFNRTRSETALYSELKYAFLNNFNLVSGLRVSKFGTVESVFVEPRVRLDFEKDKLQLYLYYNEHHQAIKKLNSSENPNYFQGLWYLADGKQVPVTNIKSFGGAIGLLVKKISLKLEVYQKQLESHTDLMSKYDFELSKLTKYINGSINTKGIEFSATHSAKNRHSSLNLTYNDTKHTFSELNFDGFNAPYQPKLEVKAIENIRLNSWSIGLVGIAAICRPHSVRKYERKEDFFGNLLYIPSNLNLSEYNSQFLPPYYRLDFSVGYSKKETFKMSVDLLNILNTQNIWYQEISLSAGKTPKINTTYHLPLFMNIKCGWSF